jgi:hypothetical protein
MKLPHRYVYLSIVFYNYTYTEASATQNGDNLQQLIMDALMQNPFKFHSAAEHFQNLIPAPKILNIITI